MQSTVPTLLLVAAISSLALQSRSGFAQGALTPSGPPGPMMKTLDQIEPRTPVAANTTPGDASDSYLISVPGSYYLTTNIVGVSSNNAIRILANNVTLDLNGFTIQGVSTSSALFYNYGIWITGQTNITVRNGNIANWSQGIFGGAVNSSSLVFENLHVANCYLGPSISAGGINIVGGATVRNCTFESCYYGLSLNNNMTAMPDVISDCTANNNVFGFYTGASGIISDCSANNNSTVGIGVYGQGSTVFNCSASGNAYGIFVNGPRNRIENNHVVGSGSYGIAIESTAATNNIVIKNSVEGNPANNFYILGAQVMGPIITTTASGIITNSNPGANFSF